MDQTHSERVEMRVWILVEIARRRVVRNEIIDMSWYTERVVDEGYEKIDLFFDVFNSIERQGLIMSEPPHYRLTTAGERFLNT